jgi:hypothetical protein
VISLLLRFKGVLVPPFGPLRVLARCLIPACVVSGLIAFLGSWELADLAAYAFVVVIGMNAIVYVLGAKPETPAEPFEV